MPLNLSTDKLIISVPSGGPTRRVPVDDVIAPDQAQVIGLDELQLALRARQEFVPAFIGKAGATAGWVVTGADDGLARLPASQTASTLVLPLTGLAIGEQLSAVSLLGQVESAGNAASLTLSVRRATAAAADFADAELGSGTSGSLTADTLLGEGGTAVEVTGLSEVLGATELLYALITGTTAALTDIAVAGLLVTIADPSN